VVKAFRRSPGISLGCSRAGCPGGLRVDHAVGGVLSNRLFNGQWGRRRYAMLQKAIATRFRPLLLPGMTTTARLRSTTDRQLEPVGPLSHIKQGLRIRRIRGSPRLDDLSLTRGIPVTTWL